MLVVYSSVLKKDDFLRRYAEDCHSASSVANDLTCNLKSLSVMSSDGKLDLSLKEIDQAQENLKELTALLDNLKNNMHGYINSLIPKLENPEEDQESKPVSNVKEEEKQINDFLNAVKSLKDLKESLGK